MAELGVNVLWPRRAVEVILSAVDYVDGRYNEQLPHLRAVVTEALVTPRRLVALRLTLPLAERMNFALGAYTPADLEGRGARQDALDLIAHERKRLRNVGARLDGWAQRWGEAASRALAAHPAPGDALTAHLRPVDPTSVWEEDLNRVTFLTRSKDDVWALGRVVHPHGDLVFQSAAGGAVVMFEDLEDIYALDFPPMSAQALLHGEGDI
ncbi:hypothetical protein [Deinococcus kurensis]|uniref:hypothetical protein n=1 Tax=Deinococcus kurensis TaxID=2662757 RepID=UPI0012D2EB1E|nr:hypothetical protein [Deinococcus kurensis]